MLDGLECLWKDAALVELLQAEGLSKRPELSAIYNGTPTNFSPKGGPDGNI